MKSHFKMRDKPEISIITPAYNSELHISETIESVISQSFSNWEMIVVDDGSIDRTGDIVLSYAKADQRIKYHKIEKNSGRPAVPRNLAVEFSQGDYVAFLDSDDTWFKEKLMFQLDFMRRYDYDFSFGPTKTNDGRVAISIRHDRQRLIYENYVACSTVMVRNRIEYRPIFDEDILLKAIEDYLAWLRLCNITQKVGCYDKPMSMYRMNSANSILKEYHRDQNRKMACDFYLYSKAYLGGFITTKEAIRSYTRIFISNRISAVRIGIVKRLKPLLFYRTNIERMRR